MSSIEVTLKLAFFAKKNKKTTALWREGPGFTLIVTKHILNSSVAKDFLENFKTKK